MIEFLRKIINNKILIISISILTIGVLMLIARKFIDSYEFEINNSEMDELVIMPNANEEKESGEIKDEVLEMENEVENLDEGNLNNEGKNVDDIFVHVAGEVNMPGVVQLKVGARVVDAINAVGGTTANADISDINLAYLLEDGMKINIPNKDDVKNNEDSAYVIHESESSNGRIGERKDNAAEREVSDRNSTEFLSVNINTATQTELESLPGIGPSIALKIINYRKEHGKFSSIDDLKNVSGIGEAKFNAIKEFIVVF